MATPVAVDVEAIATTYLRALMGAQVFTELPPNPSYPLVIINRFGGGDLVPRWLDRATLQLEGWGTTKDDARLVAATAIAHLYDSVGATTTGVVTAFNVVAGLSWLPDPDTEQPRYIATVAITAHP